MKKRKPTNGKAKKSDLAFFLEPPKQKRGWTDRKIRTFCRVFKTTRDLKKLSKAVGLSEFSITNMKGEMRRAARAGYSLDEYLAKGRPLKPGNEVLAK